MKPAKQKRQGGQTLPVNAAPDFSIELTDSIAPSAEQLLCELQLHQAELVAQNEELRGVKLELELERSRYFTLYELAPVGYCTVSETGVILQANLSAAKLLGVDRWTMIKRPLSAYMPREGGDLFHILSKRLTAKGETKSIDVPMVKSDGTQIIVSLAGTTVTDSGGKTVMLIVLNDVTERWQMEALRIKKEAAESANQAKSRFLAAASHDLRQPTHAMGMFAARLAELPHEAEAQSLVNFLTESISNLQGMLDSLFDVSQLDTESLQVKVAPFPINQHFDQLHNSFAGAAAQKGLRLRFLPSSAWLNSDPVLFHRILLNLVSNAIRYTTQGGVLVACRHIPGSTEARIVVWDSGIGIPQQHHERIFDEFFQIDNAERDRAKGLGLGLSIVDRTCRLLNHPLHLRSDTGRGSRFSVTVPLAEVQSNAQHEAAPSATDEDRLDGLNLLLIEDDELGRKALTIVLETWGCTVTATHGTQMACEQIALGQIPDIIVSDYRLRDGRNGIETIHLLREIAGQEIAACLISGDADVKVRQLAQVEGLVLLQKPVRPAKLRNLLRHLNKEKTAQAQMPSDIK